MKSIVRLLAAAALVLPLSAQTIGNLKITGYLQGQYVHDDERSQFSVRRARVKFTYQATKTSKIVLEPDVASSGVTLKDGYVELTEPWTKWKHTLTAGQFKWPFGHELFLLSSSRREVPERSRAIRTLFAGERDRGVMLSGTANRFTYRVAVVNGSGARSDDTNARKDVVGRLGYTLGAVSAGASIYRGSEPATAGGEHAKRRAGFDVQWQTPLPGFTLRGEYIAAEQSGRDVDGWYVYAIQNLGKRHQLAVRLDEYDAARAVAGAYSFQWDDHSKVMLAYETGEIFTMRYQFSF